MEKKPTYEELIEQSKKDLKFLESQPSTFERENAIKIIKDSLVTHEIIENAKNIQIQSANLLIKSSQLINEKLNEIPNTSLPSQEKLEAAFKEIFKTMDLIDAYRQQSLPVMRATIESMENTIVEAKKHIKSPEQIRKEVIREVNNTQQFILDEIKKQKLGEVHTNVTDEKYNVDHHYDADPQNPNAVKTLGKIHKFRAEVGEKSAIPPLIIKTKPKN